MRPENEQHQHVESAMRRLGTMRSTMGPGALVALAAGLLFGFGCAESQSSQEACNVTADCSEDRHVCHREKCIHVDEPRACSAASECLPGELCTAGFCGTGGTPDMVDDTTAPDTTDPGDTGADTGGDDTGTVDTAPDLIDTTAPSITARSPEPDASDVALDSVVTVTFSEPLIGATVNADTLRVDDPSGRRAAGTVTWDEASLTATLTFDAPLEPWTEYEVTASASILDRSMIPLVETRWTFSTVEPAALGAHEALARAYAPLLYLDAGDRKRDVPVAVDFDGNLATADNPGKIAAANVEPVVYYSVSQTESHHFVHYVLYFPSYRLSTAAPAQDHAVVAALVVVERGGDDGLGTLEFFETYSIGDDPGRIDTFLPQCDETSTEPFCPLEFSGNAVVIDRFHDVPAAAYADVDGRRVHLYVHYDDHELCHWTYENTGAGYCGRTGSTFTKSDNAVLVAADDGASGTLDWAAHTGTYRLEHLGNPWWLERDSVGAETTAFYRDAALYRAPATAIGGANDRRVPTTLNTDDTSGNTGYYTPWAMRANDGFGLETGAWFVDPARAVNTRLTAPATFEYRANKYCYSLYTGIDRSSDPLCQ